ncbi:MAG: hypothetical protein PHQ04_07960 [Opitutaceae bacterium]|nr:hypothetical protein [Opitutaceae bacterium]
MDKPWKIVLVALFLAGGATGGFVIWRLDRGFLDGRHAPGPRLQRQRTPVEQWAQSYRSRFAERVNLTPDQQRNIDKLVRAAQTELRHLRQQSFKQAAEITDRLDKGIKEMLTSEQRPKAEEFWQERRERARHLMQEREMLRDASGRPHFPFEKLSETGPKDEPAADVASGSLPGQPFPPDGKGE